MIVVKLLGISAAIAIIIKQSANFLPVFTSADQNTIAITAISIPVSIFVGFLFWNQVSEPKI